MLLWDLLGKFPGTDYESFNYDWIIGKLKELKDSVAAALASEQAAAESAEEAHVNLMAATIQAAHARTYAEHAADSASDAAKSAASIADVADQVAVNTGRINNLVANAGDTDNNAELLDIRVAANGVTYDTAGDAVRSQAEWGLDTVNTFCGEWGNHGISSSGAITNNDNWWGLASYLPCKEDEYYTIQYSNHTYGMHILVAFLQADNTFISRIDMQSRDHKVCVQAPENAAKMTVAIYDSNQQWDGINVVVMKGVIAYIDPDMRGYTAVDNDARNIANKYVNLYTKDYSDIGTNNGYIGTSGQINQASANNEKYTDMIPVSEGDTITTSIIYDEPQTGHLWVCIAYYNDSAFVSRKVLVDETFPAFAVEDVAPANVTGARISWRDYTGATFGCTVFTRPAIETSENKMVSYPWKPCYDHLFVSDAMPYITVPHESIYHAELSALLGFDVMELNVAKTSDDVYFANHLNNGAFGRYFVHVDGVTDVSNIQVNTVTWAWIQQNIRYNTTIDKYKTAPVDLETLLGTLKKNNLTPFITCTEQAVIDMARKVFGAGNFIAYNGSRSMCPTEWIYRWASASDVDEIVNICETYGAPFIYGMANPEDFTDDELSTIIETLHDKGYKIGTSYQDRTWYHLQELGFDVNGTQTMVNRITEPSKEYASITNFNNFTHTGTITNGTLHFNAIGTIKPNATGTNKQYTAIDIAILLNGTITIPAIGEHHAQTSYSGVDEWIYFTSPIINGTDIYTITAASGTEIKDIKYRIK